MAQRDDIIMTEDVRKELEKIIKNENIKNPKIEINSVTNKGDNNIGIMTGISVFGSNKDLFLICKSEPENQVLRVQFRIPAMFGKEEFAYLKCFPLYEKFQKSKGVDVGEGFFNYPKCYSFTEAGIFMEDLRQENYMMLDKFKDATFDGAKVTMETLGKFHAVGLAIKYQWPEELEECKNHLSTDLYGKPIHEGSYSYFQASLKFALDTLEDHETNLRTKLSKATDNIKDLLPTILNGENAEPYSTFTHGDFWNNNILYQLNKNDDPVKACFIDYQLFRYSTPVTDITEYFFICTSQKFRDQYFEELLQIYHNSLSSLLKKLGSDPNKVFPFTALEDQLRRFGMFGVVFSSVILSIILPRGSDCFDTEKCAEKMVEEKDFAKGMQLITNGDTYKLYKEKMSDVIRFANSIGII